ncbi:MAG: hypothetical protein ACFFFH_16635, partial [Candidatus Thorarchaeota archaeon]
NLEAWESLSFSTIKFLEDEIIDEMKKDFLGKLSLILIIFIQRQLNSCILNYYVIKILYLEMFTIENIFI